MDGDLGLPPPVSHPQRRHPGSCPGRSVPGPYDQGWKDTVFVNKGEKVQLAIKFGNYQGRYVFHCHNLEHEDMGMMANFRIA